MNGFVLPDHLRDSFQETCEEGCYVDSILIVSTPDELIVEQSDSTSVDSRVVMAFMNALGKLDICFNNETTKISNLDLTPGEEEGLLQSVSQHGLLVLNFVTMAMPDKKGLNRKFFPNVRAIIDRPSIWTDIITKVDPAAIALLTDSTQFSVRKEHMPLEKYKFAGHVSANNCFTKNQLYIKNNY